MAIKIKDLDGKGQGSDFALGILLILAMVVSFMLGRMSKESKNAIIIEGENIKTAQINPSDYTIEKADEKAEEEGLGEIVASKIGSKYYFIWCSGAKSLSETNKIYFNTETEAEEAGYSLATNCNNK